MTTTPPIFNGDKAAYVQSTLETYPPRYAELGDVDQLVDFDYAVFPGGTGMGHRFLTSHIKRNPIGIEIVQVRDEIAACVIGDVLPSNVEQDRCYGYITSIGVAEQYRGRGFGELLLKRMMASMLEENPTGIGLHTRVSNFSMQALARKLGFKAEVTEINYYANSAVPEDAFFMAYRLGAA